MKKVFFILVLVPFIGMAQKKGFTINGSISDLPNKSEVSLTDLNNPTDTLSKSSTANNAFVLKGELTEPALYYLNLSGGQKKYLLFLDNNTITINGSVADVQKLKVTGSPTNSDFQEFQSTFTPYFTKLNQLNEQVKTAGLTDKLSEQTIKLTREIKDGVEKFLHDKRGSYVDPFVLTITAQLINDYKVVETHYNDMADNVKQSFYGKYIKDYIDNNKFGAVGTDALDFTQTDTDGKQVSLSSFRGKYVLIDFWASWCGPCRQENPNVVKTYAKYKNKNFTVLGISLDKTRDPWLKAIKDDNLTWTHVSDLKFWNNEVAQKYKIQSIPANFLIDPNGKIVGRDLRGPLLAQRLDELLK